MVDNEKLIESLNKFTKAALELSSIWEETSEETQDALCLGYPFLTSFDEVVTDMMDWAVQVKTKIGS